MSVKTAQSSQLHKIISESCPHRQKSCPNLTPRISAYLAYKCSKKRSNLIIAASSVVNRVGFTYMLVAWGSTCTRMTKASGSFKFASFLCTEKIATGSFSLSPFLDCIELAIAI